MSIVSDFGKKVSNKTKEISQKAKIMSETNALNNVIKGEECKIDFQYKVIGKLYYEKFGENPEADFTEAIETIKASMQKIEETSQEIKKIKSRFNCPNCGEAFKNDALFCSKCGTKLPEREEKTKIPDDAKKCEKCGNLLKKDALFCNLCGNKLDAADAEPAESKSDVSSEAFAPAKESSEQTPVSLSKTETTSQQTTLTEETKSDEKPAEATESKETASAEKPAETEQPSAPQEEAVNEAEKATESAENAVEATAEKICPNCKNKMLDDDIFCNECGTKVE